MSVFKFKKFSIHQDKCAQKVGTDGVLLGAWCKSNYNAPKCLDVGTGSGLISLMLAQRFSDATIDAIELDADAYEQCVENFENSIWSDRLFCYHASFQEFYEEIDEEYDLIISNPPFYHHTDIQASTNISPERKRARFDDSLPFEELIYGIYKLLHEDGIFSGIIPYYRQEEFLTIARHYNLHPSRITHVKGTKESIIKRSLVELRFKEISGSQDDEITLSRKHNYNHNELIIENSRHDYTADYQNLVKEFYLKM